MEDFKFLAAYKLKPTVGAGSTTHNNYTWAHLYTCVHCVQDILEFKPKYRPMVFELRVYPHDLTGDHNKPYCSPELLVAQDTLTSEVVELLCNTA